VLLISGTMRFTNTIATALAVAAMVAAVTRAQAQPATTMIVAGDADIFPPAHAVEVFGLLGGGKKDGGWDGSGQPKNRLAILPGLTHYTIFSAPALAATVIPFLDEPAPAARPAGTK
jgi:hypothetical protein